MARPNGQKSIKCIFGFLSLGVVQKFSAVSIMLTIFSCAYCALSINDSDKTNHSPVFLEETSDCIGAL